MEGKEASQAGKGGDQVVGVAGEDEMSSDVIQQKPTSTSVNCRQEWAQSILDVKEKKIRTEAQTQKQRIHKVPQKLRSKKNMNTFRFYEPMVIAIGPYHHGKRRLQQAEELKPTIAKQFVRSHLIKSTELESVINALEEIQKLEVRKLYDKVSTEHIDEESLARMMFLDGCFILHFIYCIVNFQTEDLGMKNCHIDLAQQDLFLLENQLPFEVLQVLINLDDNDFWKSMMLRFIELITITPLSLGAYDLVQAIKPIHLLDLLRKALIGVDSKNDEKFIPISIGERRQKRDPIRGRMFRSVKELTAAGIHLKPSSTRSSGDIIFSSYCIYGKLTLPRLTINSSTEKMFLNLIAHEECMDDRNESGFTSYICFLDALIDHAEDVKELRSAGILDNLLGSDEDVATLFNKMADDLVPEVDTYRDVKMKIRNYFQDRGKIKMASWVDEVLRDHFRSPWSAIAVFAAIFVISVSVAQTYFTIFPLADKCAQ